MMQEKIICDACKNEIKGKFCELVIRQDLQDTENLGESSMELKAYLDICTECTEKFNQRSIAEVLKEFNE
jgi:hypothetical protein